MNKLQIVLDTNIYASAIFWEGNPYRIDQKALNGELSVFVSEDMIKELKRVLERDFSLTEEGIAGKIDALLSFAKEVDVNQKLSVVKDDPDDDRILECALSANAEYIVTQDNHLLRVREFRGIKIVNPKDFIDILSG